MSLRDGIEVKSYADLIKQKSYALFFEPNGDRVFAYNTEFGCPGMVHVETGERFYSEDIQKYVRFPLYRVKLVAFTQEDLDVAVPDMDETTDS